MSRKPNSYSNFDSEAQVKMCWRWKAKAAWTRSDAASCRSIRNRSPFPFAGGTVTTSRKCNCKTLSSGRKVPRNEIFCHENIVQIFKIKYSFHAFVVMIETVGECSCLYRLNEICKHISSNQTTGVNM